MFIKVVSLYLAHLGKMTSELNTFGGGQSSGSVILEEELIKRFPEQFQDPNEPEFH